MSSLKLHKIQDIIWVAALIEGEGSFGVVTRKKSERQSPFFYLSMSDKDVVEGIARCFPDKRVRTRVPHKVHHKIQYVVETQRKDLIEQLLTTIIPYLGHRRTQKAKEVLRWINNGRLGRELVATRSKDRGIGRTRVKKSM